MKKQQEEQVQRLQADIEHLEEEVANNELTSAHSVGEDLRYHERIGQELRETLTSKRQILAQLEA